jgi:hypothetical protein
METKDLIDNIQMGDAQTSNNTFNSVMAVKMNVALDDRKAEVAQAMYAAPAVEADDA